MDILVRSFEPDLFKVCVVDGPQFVARRGVRRLKGAKPWHDSEER
jgi:hypothetical protein